MSNDSTGQPAAKIGQGHAMGMLRLGAHELTQALAAFPDSNIRPLEEPGVFGNPTPQLVTTEMTGQEVGPATDTIEAPGGDAPTIEAPEMDMEMEV